MKLAYDSNIFGDMMPKKTKQQKLRLGKQEN